MDFSFNIEGQALTGSIQPEAMMGISSMVGSLFGGFIFLGSMIYIAVIVLMLLSRWKIFTKAKLPGRGILIPIYNQVLIFKIGGLSGRWTLSLLFPPLFLVVKIINYFNISERFGKHWTFGLGMLFIKIVFIPILAFDESKHTNNTIKKIGETFANNREKEITGTEIPTKKITTKKPVKKTTTKKTTSTKIKKVAAKKPITKNTPTKKTVTKKPAKKATTKLSTKKPIVKEKTKKTTTKKAPVKKVKTLTKKK